jgi:hypothetical protein
MRLIRVVFFSMIVVAISASAVFAQNSRTFVSGSGLDSNPCSLSAPCRTMTQALTVTNAGGEVVILSTAGYGPFTVNKAVTIEAPPGIYAGITATSGGNGIDINADFNDVVTLRGFTVTNQGTSTSTGIAFNSGATLNIENCVVDGFSGDGISINNAGKILVKDTVVRNNGAGFFVNPFANGTTNITMDHVCVESNGTGVSVDAGEGDTGPTPSAVSIVIRNSSLSNNDQAVFVFPEVGVVSVGLERCLISNNIGSGMAVSALSPASASVTISNCTISRNTGYAFSIGSGGTIFSRGNNIFIGNGTNSGSLTPFPAQ